MEELIHATQVSWSALLHQVARELDSTQPGTDVGLLPVNCALMQLEESLAKVAMPAPIPAQVAAASTRIGRLFDTTAQFDAPSLAWLRDWQRWMQAAVEAWRTAGPIPVLPEELRPFAGETNSPDQSFVGAMAASAGGALSSSPVGTPTTETPITLQLASDGDLLREFCAESQEHLQNIEQGVLVLEDNPADADTLNSIFRAFHTFKGGSGFLNLITIKHLAHELESLLDAARQHKLSITSDIIDLILEGSDTLRQFVTEMLAQINGINPGEPILIPTMDLIGRVQGVLEVSRAVPSMVAAPPAPRDGDATDRKSVV